MRITVKQDIRSIVTVILDGTVRSLPKGSKRDVIVDVEDGVIVGPPDLISKIKNKIIDVVEWNGLRIDGFGDAPQVKAETKPETKAAKPIAPAAKPIAPPVKADPKPKQKGDPLAMPPEVK